MSDNAPALPGAVFDMPPYAAGFELRGAWLIRALMSDLDLLPFHGAGIVGNLGGESEELKPGVQEVAPLAGRGGLGWGQWTGPRRTAFERFCSDHGLMTNEDQANYLFLLEELRGSQAHALAQLKKTSTVEAATYTFEVYYEAPADLKSGLPLRTALANRALQAFNKPTAQSAKLLPPRPMPVRVVSPRAPAWLPPPPPASTTVPAMSQVGAFSVGAAGASIPAKALVATLVWLLEPWRAVPDELQLLWLGTVVIIGGIVAHSVIVNALRDRIVKDLEA